MNHRERLLTALHRRPPDRAPFSLGFAAAKYEEFVRRTGHTDPAEYFDLDFRHVPVKTPRRLPDFSRYFKGRVPDWLDTQAEDFLFVPFRGAASYCRMGPNRTALNEWGEYRIYGEDEDYHAKVFPLAGESLTLSDVERFPLPDLSEPYRYEGIREKIDELHARGLAAVLGWEMTIFEKAWRIRGLEEMMVDFVTQPALVECLVERVAEQTGALAERYAALGVDLIQFGDDIASQQGMLMSLRHWRRFLKPRMAQIIARVKRANPHTLAFYHSDGNVEAVVPDLIEIGVDVLNPIQPECVDIPRLKQRFGKDLSFWGGIGVQSVMPFGTAQEVRAAVQKLMADAGAGGGLVIATAHVIEKDIPWENVEAFVGAAHDFGGY
jgi:uroporphyrinogen decarboxylase